jgi:DNA-binding CsgD family transcriptional regulator
MPEKKSQMKLKSMNEVSAAEAVRIFNHLEYGGPPLEYLKADEFPKDISARDFFETFMLYKELLYGKDIAEVYHYGPSFSTEQMEEMRSATPEQLSKLTPEERKLYDLVISEPDLHIWVLANELGKSMSTVKTQKKSLCDKLRIRNSIPSIIATSRPSA